MKEIWKRRFPAFTLALALLFLLGPIAQPKAMAAGSGNQAPDTWAVTELVDAEALGLLPEDVDGAWKSPVSSDQLLYILNGVARDLEQLDLGKSGVPALPSGSELTRGTVAEYLYAELCMYQLPGSVLDRSLTPLKYMTQQGVLRGNAKGELEEKRLCTLQEALVLAQRVVSNLYNDLGQASNGLLWKATKGDNTLYLLGTIHVDRGMVYPFSGNLLAAIRSAQTAVFEVDFNDQEELNYFYQKQQYSDGTTLKAHIPAVLYDNIIETMKGLGYTEEQAASLKPWALANLFSTLSLKESGDTSSLMVIDTYVYSKELVEGKRLGQVEGYRYQADLFDSLSEDYQLNYLAGNYVNYLLSKQNGGATENTEAVDQWLTYWRARNAQQFEEDYNASTAGQENDELYQKLYGTRNDNMTQAAVKLLETEGSGTSILVVGAGHMVGETGVVNQLKKLGYQVELAPLSD